MTVDGVTADVAAAPPDGPTDDTDSTGNTVVELQVFGRSVRVEAHAPLDQVTAAAVNLWQHLDGQQQLRGAPIGTAGFYTADPYIPPADPLDGTGRPNRSSYGRLGDIR